MRPVNEDEITAWHEAGHAFMAAILGGEVDSISIDPDWDDGPKRFGDTTVRWHANRFTQQQLQRNAVLVALAGPVTEMIHRGDPLHPATVAEWAMDWGLAWQAAAFLKSDRERMKFLERSSVELYQTLSQDNHWAAIGAIVDHLLAYETLEGETVHEIVAEWT
ncbi:M50 family metallopeptidase [Fuerstiella marisgermanici]|uniref:Peptidase family M41 n=1 Tax=Fuerstiella marisgermanici TaxID=1891926 RepID=A0A1P8WS48_9PLAN|nr:M50 family metallopeptidase [Fuerstiella marisgermanici]APZ96884.1 Peptidase family M41 [Fuerstiella marisgermanici]